MRRHPLHPALVHFPIACWTLAVVADFASLRWGEAAWHWSAGLLTVGCLMALVAVIAGMAEIPNVPEGRAQRTVNLHMGLMLVAFTLFATRLLLRIEHTQPLAPDATALVLDALGITTLVAGGWLGAQLVYRHGVGSDSPRP
ncbi:MAG: hypothetical protein ABS45_14055 [Comamonas sp. SCN 65-56]|uniref:DUF2231 domain-containing protein n=1 Tax=Comamonas sp. SCN 65-56 TaxID=1660095 RepID=UPI000869E5C6|nr:DUF2231 domain-containing protein [Comamonas sp. SCN 65-56]ODS90783.1 MAG: hypothetical protein ABS45_14055 [Comamonas sp. SCN 65-56]